MKFRRLFRAAALALFAVISVPAAFGAIDLITDMGGFSAGQITGLRDSFVPMLPAGSTTTVTAEELDDVTLQIVLTDLSTASTYWAVSHWAGTVTDWYCVLETAITGADTTLLMTVNGVIPSAGSTVTIVSSGSSVGDIDSSSSVTGSTIAAGQAIAVNTDGTTTSVSREICTVVINR